MKERRLKQFIILGLLFLAQGATGQIPAIDSLEIIPENPTVNDEIKVVCYTTFPSGPCELSDHSFDIQGGSITLLLDYTVGGATYICHSVDTLSIGNLGMGDYELEAGLTIDHLQDTIFDTHTIYFSVESDLGIPETISNSHLSIYPNPFQNELTIATNVVIDKMEIFSVFGQEITLAESGIQDKQMDVSHLENGIYLFILTDSKGNKYSKKVIKTTR